VLDSQEAIKGYISDLVLCLLILLLSKDHLHKFDFQGTLHRRDTIKLTKFKAGGMANVGGRKAKKGI